MKKIKFILFFIIIIYFSCPYNPMLNEDNKNKKDEKKEHHKKEDDKLINQVNFDYYTFQENVNKWNNLNIEKYSFDYYSKELILYDLTLDISDGTVINLTKKDPKSVLIYTTIDDLITQINDHYLKYNNKEFDKNVDWYLTKIEVIYDNTKYFPIECHYYYNFDFYIIEVDQNLSWSVTNFIIK